MTDGNGNAANPDAGGYPIRVLLVDDDALVRSGLSMILSDNDRIQVVAEASDGDEAVNQVLAHHPDVVMMDIRMPRVDGLSATRSIRALANAPEVLVLTTFDLDDYVFRALEAGASGFLLKDTPPLDLIAAVETIAGGDAMLSPRVTRTLIGHFAGDGGSRREAARQRLDGITGRENEVLIEVARGHSNADIGRSLFMSEATVKSHMSRVMQKVGIENRVQAAIIAHDAGLV